MSSDREDNSESPPAPGDSDSRSTLRGNVKDDSEKANNNGEQGKGAGDEENNEGPPLPVGFWDPSLNKVRLEVFKKWAIISEYLRSITSRRLLIDQPLAFLPIS